MSAHIWAGQHGGTGRLGLAFRAMRATVVR